VSARGTHIPLDTFNYFEDGVDYSCRLHFNEDFEIEGLSGNILNKVEEYL